MRRYTLIHSIICFLSTLAAVMILLVSCALYWDNLMPDAPDDYEYGENIQLTPISDGGEIAARINSAVALSRHGNVLFYTDFSKGMAGIAWEDQDVNNIVRIKPTSYGRSGLELYAYSNKNYDDAFNGSMAFPIIEGQYYILDFEIVAGQGTGGYDLYGRVGINGVDYIYELTYYKSPKDITVWNDTSSEVSVVSRFESEGAHTTRHRVELIIDVVNGTYKSLTYNSDKIDISDISMDTVLSGSVDQITCIITPFTTDSTYFVLEIQNIVLAVANTVPN